MDRLQAMQLFVRVAELNSFSAVAQQMGVARSVVTRQIAALEQQSSSTPFWRRFLRARQLGWVLDAIDAPERNAAAPSHRTLETV